MADGPKNQSNPEELERIVEDFTNRIRAGEHPAIGDYQDQYPEFKDEIEDLLASVAMIEQLKSSPTQPRSTRRSLDEVSALKQIGDYQVIGELGRGGMGVVFEAIHESLGRRVAIKVMPTPLMSGEKHVERFKREAKSAARLHHTNIVGVFGVGEGEGYHYYVMDFVDGQSLSEVVRGLSDERTLSGSTRVNEETRLDSQFLKDSTNVEITTNAIGTQDESEINSTSLASRELAAGDAARTSVKLGPKHFRWAARIGSNVADALAYAHAAEILHRDIKPSNIILDRKGVVWITDFGLAKDSTSEINLTKTGDVIGTPQYLAPESLEGKYDQRSEVYCLGLTLYELATLQPAYKSGTTAEVIGAIATSSPVSPRKLVSRIPIDLSTIIDKAVARDPKMRYQTASEMQKDLLAFIEDRPIAARPPSTVENVIKWGRRNPLAAALSAVSALLLVLVAVSASIGYLYTTDALARVQDQQKETERRRKEAVSERKKAEDFATEMQAQYNRAEGNIAITIEAFDEMFKQVVARGSNASGDVDLNGFEELAGIETSITREDAAFLDKLLVFYDKFAKQNADNDSLRIESARAFRRVANIYQLIGDTRRATEAYRNSINGYEQAQKLSPDSKAVLISLVNTKCELSSLYRRNRKLKEAYNESTSAIELIQSVPVDQLDNELKLETAKALNSLGSSATLFAALERKSPSLFEEFIRSRLRGNRPGGHAPPPRRGDPRNEGRWAGDRGLNGRAAGRTGTPDGRGGNRPDIALGYLSSEYSRDAIQILNELIKKDPQNAEYRSVLANCYCSLAAAMLKPDPAKARMLRDKAISELEKLIEEDADNHQYQYRLALACSLGGADESSKSELDLLKKSIRIVGTLTEKFPQFLDYHYLKSSVHIKYADRLMQSEKYEESLDSLRTAKDSLEHVSELSRPDRTQDATRLVIVEQLRALSKETESKGMTELSRDSRLMLSQLLYQMRNRGNNRPGSRTGLGGSSKPRSQ